VHTHINCIITHREVGIDTVGWFDALKDTLRQAPDVILIGEIRESRDDGIRAEFCRDRTSLHGDAALPQRPTRQATAL